MRISSRLKIHKHDEILIIVWIGTLINIVQLYGLYRIFGVDYVQSRAIINSMTILAPLLCLGFDTAAPLITKLERSSSFIWNFLIAQLFFMGFFLLVALNLDNQKTSYIFFGLSLGALFSSNLFLLEYQRSLGQIKEYFFNLHIRDRFYRMAIILLTALASTSFLTWVYTLILFFIIFLGFSTKKYWKFINFNPKKLCQHLTISLPYLFIAISAAAITRLPFYVSYYLDSYINTAKIDFWLMLSLFMLLPYMNILKIAETETKGQTSVLLSHIKGKTRKLSQQQMLISLMILFVAGFGLIIGMVERQDIYEIILPLIISIVIITSAPPFSYLALSYQKIKLASIATIIISMISLACYTPSYFNVHVPIAYLMIINASIYLSINILASSYFFRLRVKSLIVPTRRSGVIIIISVLFGIIYQLSLINLNNFL